mgnify:CR=1 FL=1
MQTKLREVGAQLGGRPAEFLLTRSHPRLAVVAVVAVDLEDDREGHGPVDGCKDGVADVAGVGVPDERMGEVGKAFVVRADSPAGEALTADDVTAFAREHLANVKVPRQVEFTGALPRNLSGKVLKKDLR